MNDNQLLECFEDLDDFPYDNGHGAGDPEDDDLRKKFILNLIIRLSRNPNILFDGIDAKKQICTSLYTLCTEATIIF